MNDAQEAKYQVEEAQRAKLRKRESEGNAWKPEFFEKDGSNWAFIGKNHPEFEAMKERENFGSQTY